MGSFSWSKVFDWLSDKANKLWKWITKLDWSDPKVILTGIICLLAPFVFTSVIKTALLLGLLMSFSVLWGVSKLPDKAKIFIQKHLVASRLGLSILAAISIAGLFGVGLTLGLGVVICDVILSLCLPHLKLSGEVDSGEPRLKITIHEALPA